MDSWNLIAFREGRILRMQWFADRDELEAAGLRE
jgi:hypothetical protein